MKTLQRVGLSAACAAATIAAAAGLLLFRGGETAVEDARGKGGALMSKPTTRETEPPTPSPSAEVPLVPGSLPPQAAPPTEGGRPERLIEEELAEAGEDPGAVYYMSRIREAIVEGNPRFGRELLHQMKEEHGESVLFAEAETLFEALKVGRRR